MARGPLLLDTSAAVPLVVEAHASHRAVRAAVGREAVGLAGHAAFETYSVLTRLPVPSRRRPSVVRRLLSVGFPHTVFPSAERMTRLYEELAELGVAGGAVYDALVGVAAVEHRRTLVTRDLRALETYGLVGAATQVVT